jgi:hypothetical protein
MTEAQKIEYKQEKRRHIVTLHSELRILDWILYVVYSNEIKQFERI